MMRKARVMDSSALKKLKVEKSQWKILRQCQTLTDVLRCIFLIDFKAMNGNSNCRMWVVTERDWTAFRIEFRTANPISFKSAMKSFFSNQSGINMVTNQPKNVYLYSISA